MSQLDRVPKEILDYWKSFETENSIVQFTVGAGVNSKNITYVFFLGSKRDFSPHKVFAFGDEERIIYYLDYTDPERKQYSEQEFLKLIKMKVFW